MDRLEALRRLGEARVGRLATADSEGTPHVVPFVFALEGETLYWAVDQKRKRSKDLKRLANIRENPRVEVVVDSYDEDWTKLWWVRGSGMARILDPGDEHERALSLLAQKYRQYVAEPPAGPAVAIDLEAITSWSA